MAYDFTQDVADLVETLSGVYADVADEIVEGVDEDDEEKGYRLLASRVDELDNLNIKASPEIEPVSVEMLGGAKTGIQKGLPFSFLMMALLASSKQNTVRNATQQTYDMLRHDTNERTRDFRMASKSANSNAKVFDLARQHMDAIPDKVEREIRKGRDAFSIGIGVNFDLKFEEFNRKAREYLFGKDFKITSQNITTNMRERLQATLARGYETGESVKQMTSRVRRVLGEDSNAEMIAVTELAGAANYGEYEFAEEYRQRYGVEIIKTWIQIIRKSMRKTHAAVAGQSLKFEEKFEVGGEEMERPHDPNASASNVVKCGCSLAYETGSARIEGVRDERGVGQFIRETENNPDSEPYVNATRIGDFTSVMDAAEYVADTYGITVDQEFEIEQMNAIADILDAMPYEVMLKNMKLTQILASGAAVTSYAQYSLDGKLIRFNDPQHMNDELFRYTLGHEVGHSLHYQFQSLYESFARICWTKQEPGTVFDAANWARKTEFGFLTKNSLESPMEQFAESVTWFLNRNSEMYELAKKDEPLMKIYRLFENLIGPVKP